MQKSYMRVCVSVLAAFGLQGAFAVTGTATINCTEQDIGGGKKELTCTLGSVKFVVPNTLSLPNSSNGNQFDLTTASTGFTCNPTVTGVAGGSQQTSTFTSNCTGNSPPTTFTWSWLDAAAASAAQATIANPSTQDTSATLTLGSNVASLGVRLTACTSAGVGCQNFDRAIANTTLVLTPTNCSLTGVPSGNAVAENASVQLNVAGCQNLQAGVTYTWRFNGQSVGTSLPLSHTPFPAGSTATSGIYILSVCNPNSTTTVGCMTVPNANGLTITKTSTSGGELALCPAGAAIDGTIDLSQEASKVFFGYTSSGNAPLVYRVIVPPTLPGGDTNAAIAWNSSPGAAVGKTIQISRDQACGTVGAATLGTTWSSGQRLVFYRTSQTPYFSPGSTWYVSVTSPNCTADCNVKLEIVR
jgi:hypothetical protein